MMSHREIRQEFDAYARAQLSEPQAALLVAHLAACPDCARAWTRHQQINQALDAVPLNDPGPDFLAGVMAALPAPAANPFPTQVAAAVLIVALTLGTWTAAYSLSLAADGTPWAGAVRKGLGWWQQQQRTTYFEMQAALKGMPWKTVSQTLWSMAIGLLIAYGVPVGERLVYARRRSQ